MSNVRAIAFVLPQFHPIPENDAWWGKGFTEWTNVTKAKPLFEGHYQPHLPTDLGFYDLRLPEARKAQADLAKAYGIHGFCYYHYWFNGKRLLNQPLDGMLEQSDLDMPFMYCWANENWTRRWDGREQDILIKQEYSKQDDIDHIRWLCKNVFSDKRYIKVNGCPVFAVYRHDLFPNIKETAKIWREIAVREFGFKDIYLCITESFNTKVDPQTILFNASIEFSPHQVLKPNVAESFWKKLGIKYNLLKQKTYTLKDYKKGVDYMISRKYPDYKLYRSVTPSWDNTARKGNKAIIGLNSSPDTYFYWLNNIIKSFTPYSDDENFIFINAMNEWAEGNHLEPCIKYGTAYLEATLRALNTN
tara:strand:- start:14088 stop:15167 length:1080 start_codon:yes stop_codon:yes gene_type:complete